MAKILFVSDNFLNEGLGIMYLSSYLKSAGHKVELTLLQDYQRVDDLIGYIKKYDPDLVGFSVMTPQVVQFRPISRLIKEKTGKTIIWGGAHCMFMQEDVMKYGCVDIICVGDGEEALMDLMNCIDEGRDYSKNPSLYVKTQNGWVKNPLRPVENNLDKYPYPDRSLYYDKYPLLAEFAVKRFITGRGCPYKCSYCFEPTYFKMLKHDQNSKAYRRHSTEYVIGEIKNVIEKYPTRRIHFNDDIFNLNKNWVKEFSHQYKDFRKIKKKYNIDYSCSIELTNIEEETIKTMADSGCRGTVFGLECGVEETRMKVLNKKIPNARYIEATNWLHKHKLKFIMNVMFCLPKESLDDAIESIRFATQLKPYGLRVCVLKMYKGTDLANQARAKGLTDGVGEFTLRAKDVHGEFDRIAHITWATPLFLRFPFLLRWARRILTNTFAKFLRPLHLLGNWEDIKWFEIPLWQAWKYFWNSRAVFIGGYTKAQEDTYVGDDGTVRDTKELLAAPLGVIDWTGERNFIEKYRSEEKATSRISDSISH